MVRINLIDPKALADQHLIAEYNEILMLLGYILKHPDPVGIPPSFLLGPGHMKFFKDKLKYIKKRHELLKIEMRKRGFQTNKTINLDNFPKKLQNDWKSKPEDIKIIKERIIWKLEQKPEYYRYYQEHKSKKFFVDLIKNSKF